MKASLVTLSGMGSKEEVKHNVDAIKNLTILKNSQIETLKSSLSQDMNQLCTTCQYCKHCPKGINIPKYMYLYKYYILKGISGIKEMYDLLSKYGDIDFEKDMAPSNCKKYENLCTQKLNIVDILNWINHNVINK